MDKAILITINNQTDTEESISLLKTLDCEVTQSLNFNVKKINPKFYLGKGQTESIKNLALAEDVDLVCFDFSLSPIIMRNLEQYLDIDILDREGVILEIFSKRARTKEAKLQVELAMNLYYLPRQKGRISKLSQQRGGVKGSRGEGERLLELDKRRLYENITKIRNEIGNVKKVRAIQNKARNRSNIFSFALIGYTNAGKSSLLNKLTNSDVLEENKLFATLDPTARILNLPKGEKVIVSDTVGFISSLPHLLIDSFKATLEQASGADAMIIVLDITHKDIKRCYETTKNVLSELGIENKPTITVLNKIDAQYDEIQAREFLIHHPDTIPASIKTGENLDLIIREMEMLAEGRNERLSIILPLEREDLIGEISKDGIIHNINYTESSIEINASIKRIYYEKYRKYLK